MGTRNLHCVIIIVLHCAVLYCVVLCYVGFVLHCAVLCCAVFKKKLYCVVWCCVVLYFVVLYCFVLHRVALYCVVLCCIVLHCVVLFCVVLYCVASCCIVLCCIVLYCIALYCIVLYCFVLYCIAQRNQTTPANRHHGRGENSYSYALTQRFDSMFEVVRKNGVVCQGNENSRPYYNVRKRYRPLGPAAGTKSPRRAPMVKSFH